VLAFDFRGYRKSEGSATQSLFDKDLRAAIAFLRERGFQRMVCLGASIGGNICGKVAHEPGLAGLVIISGPLDSLEEDAGFRKTSHIARLHGAGG